MPVMTVDGAGDPPPQPDKTAAAQNTSRLM
jgi:hypothetical protein